jgi:hypothetical protein
LDTGASDTEVEVTGASDAGEGLPFEIMTGHGLSVVAQLASRWAVDPLSDGKVVWAELPVPGLPAPGLPVSGRPGAVDPR